MSSRPCSFKITNRNIPYIIPRLATLTNSLNARSGLQYIIPKEQTTKSKLSLSNCSSSASAYWNATFDTRAIQEKKEEEQVSSSKNYGFKRQLVAPDRARFWPMAIFDAAMSVERISVLGSTLAIDIEGSPGPEATSRIDGKSSPSTSFKHCLTMTSCNGCRIGVHSLA